MDLFFKSWWDSGNENPEEFADLVQQYADIVRMLEREACAKVCEELMLRSDKPHYPMDCAAAIRARSNGVRVCNNAIN